MPISSLIMPSQSYPKIYASASIGFGVEINIPVNRDVVLDAREYISKKTMLQHKKVIIHACGNGDFHENHCQDFQKEADAFPDCKVVGFNFRNVLHSSGAAAKSEHEWVADAISVINHYHYNEGIAYSDILLAGHSLGAAILTMAAAEIYKREKAKAKIDKEYMPNCVKLINGRSFKNLGSVVCNIGAVPFLLAILTSGIAYTSLLFLARFALVLPAETFCFIAAIILPIVVGVKSPSTIAGIYTPLVNLFLSKIFGNMDALSAYKTLPDDCKEFFYAQGDGVIAGNSGLEAGLKAEKQIVKQALKAPTLDYSSQEKLETRLFEIRARKLRLIKPDMGGMAAHNDNLVFFKAGSKKYHESHQKSGQDVYNDDVSRLLKMNIA